MGCRKKAAFPPLIIGGGMAHSTTSRRNALVNAAAFVVVVAGMKAAASLVVPFLLAVFLTIISLPLLLWLEKRGIPELPGLLFILILAVGLWFMLVLLIGTALGDFTQSVPFYQERLRTIVGDAWSWLATYGLTIDRSMLDGIFDPGKIMKLLTSTLNGLGGVLKDAFLILLMFIFLILEATGIPRKIQAISRNEKGSLNSYSAITQGVNRYLAIKAMTSLTTGFLIYVLLRIQGIDFPVLWGTLAFILNFIPNIGSLIAAVPPALLALVQFGPAQATVTMLGFLAVNTVIGSILEPKIMGKGVGLSTLVVFLSLIFWGWVLGPVGMLLSVPLTMAAKIAFAEHESTSWISLLLGSNKDVATYLRQRQNADESGD